MSAVELAKELFKEISSLGIDGYQSKLICQKFCDVMIEDCRNGSEPLHEHYWILVKNNIKAMPCSTKN